MLKLALPEKSSFFFSVINHFFCLIWKYSLDFYFYFFKKRKKKIFLFSNSDFVKLLGFSAFFSFSLSLVKKKKKIKKIWNHPFDACLQNHLDIFLESLHLNGSWGKNEDFHNQFLLTGCHHIYQFLWFNYQSAYWKLLVSKEKGLFLAEERIR